MTTARLTAGVLMMCLPACAVGASGPPASTPPEPHHGGVTGHGHHGPADAHMNQASFDSVARFEDPARETWQRPDAVIAALGPLEGKTVADLGAGTGYFSVRLAQAGARVLAVDVDPRFLDYIARRKLTAARGGSVSRRKPLPSMTPAWSRLRWMRCSWSTCITT